MKTCFAGYKSLNIEPDGTISPCCIISPMHGQSLGNKLSNKSFFEFDQWQAVQKLGVDSPHCHYCRTQELAGSYSVRKQINQIVSQNESKKLEYLNINLSNLCNLTCRSCDSSRSYLIADKTSLQKAELKVNKYENIVKIVEQYRNDIRFISIQGGEPLLYKDLQELITWINKLNPSIAISIVTNLTFLPEWLIDFINRGRVARLKVSIDAIEGKAEFIRKGLNWGTFDLNLKRLIRKTNPLKIKMSTTVSIFSLFSLNELQRYLYELNLANTDFNLVCHPQHLDIKNLNKHCKLVFEKEGALSGTNGSISRHLAQIGNESIVNDFMNRLSEDEHILIKSLFRPLYEGYLQS